MIRLNLILFALTIAMALGVVTAQYKARKLYFELGQARSVDQAIYDGI